LHSKLWQCFHWFPLEYAICIIISTNSYQYSPDDEEYVLPHTTLRIWSKQCLGARQRKGLNRIANIGEGHIYLSFNHNYMIYELYITIRNGYSNNASCAVHLISTFFIVCKRRSRQLLHRQHGLRLIIA
jgi:hypothetical protein